MMCYNDGTYGMMGNIWGLIMMLGVFVIVILGIIVLVNYMKRPNTVENYNALEILNKRYANGEIAEDEYKKMKSNLIK